MMDSYGVEINQSIFTHFKFPVETAGQDSSIENMAEEIGSEYLDAFVTSTYENLSEDVITNKTGNGSLSGPGVKSRDYYDFYQVQIYISFLVYICSKSPLKSITVMERSIKVQN